MQGMHAGKDGSGDAVQGSADCTNTIDEQQLLKKQAEEVACTAATPPDLNNLNITPASYEATRFLHLKRATSRIKATGGV